mmetsp:Transcript_39200/g.90313  ORF Transcript_39200/g.90313 Transcript_39200/m.90313 type:complete len:266 (+) Transcript_39200:71-868(+)
MEPSASTGGWCGARWFARIGSATSRDDWSRPCCRRLAHRHGLGNDIGGAYDEGFEDPPRVETVRRVLKVGLALLVVGVEVGDAEHHRELAGLVAVLVAREGEVDNFLRVLVRLLDLIEMLLVEEIRAHPPRLAVRPRDALAHVRVKANHPGVRDVHGAGRMRVVPNERVLIWRAVKDRDRGWVDGAVALREDEVARVRGAVPDVTVVALRRQVSARDSIVAKVVALGRVVAERGEAVREASLVPERELRAHDVHERAPTYREFNV